MLEITSPADIAALRETYEVECKLALGKDGKGELSKDFWETYSAFANCDGGDVLLGIEENKAGFVIRGIADLSRIQDQLWSLLNNPQKVSVNILTPGHVRELAFEGKGILQVQVPRAARTQRRSTSVKTR